MRSRLGWAAQTLDVNCYDRNARPRHYMVTCDRQYSWGSAKEDYILPDAHTVVMHISPEQVAAAGAGDCVWTWQPHRGGAAETKKQPCNAKLVIKRVPFSLDRAASGVSVKVTLPNGTNSPIRKSQSRTCSSSPWATASPRAKSNPDRPVTFSNVREMVYDPINAHDRDWPFRKPGKANLNYGVAAADSGINPKSLPKRLMEDEEKELIFKPTSREFQEAFDRRNAQWLSPDCHRSQYGYPFRVSIGWRWRTVTAR